MYNTEKFVHRLLDSVLAQDYPRIEMIVVDDGSTDGSKGVVEGYRGCFEERGYTLRYVYQPNSGQSVAIKNGLPFVEGEYLTWPDSDDFYATTDAISKMVGTLESASEEFQMARTQVLYVEEEGFKTIRMEGLKAKEEEDSSLFEDCLFGRNGFYYCAGSYLVRTKVLKELTDFDIYTEKNAGQNWQLLLPVLYRYRCKTILEPLFTVVERTGSHTRGHFRGFDGSVTRYDVYYSTRVETLKRIKGLPAQSLTQYQRKLQADKNAVLLHIAIKDNSRAIALTRLPACRPDMSKRDYAVLYFWLHLPGGTCLVNGYTKLHHLMSLFKRHLLHN